MAVKRIVPNIVAGQTQAAKSFYGDILGLTLAMDMGWIMTFEAKGNAAPQLSVATEGGSGAPLPDISIEVDNLDQVYRKMAAANLSIEYPLTDEPWGVRRFFVRDPFGKLVNIIAHA